MCYRSEIESMVSMELSFGNIPERDSETFRGTSSHMKLRAVRDDLLAYGLNRGIGSFAAGFGSRSRDLALAYVQYLHGNLSLARLRREFYDYVNS